MIKAENVVKLFHGRGVTVRAVDGVSTEVKRGEVVVVIGPSATGKDLLKFDQSVPEAEEETIGK